jgi:predicted cupin superfamily sugar epimerase
MNRRARELASTLGLAPHPEGGAFAEHYRQGGRAQGADCTAIYYLLTAGAGSAWHRVRKDELWHHYEGGTVEIHVITLGSGAGPGPADEYRVLKLGSPGKRGTDANGARPCQVVPANAWQAARLAPAAARSPGYALVGNTIAPGFDFSDWSLAKPAELARLARRVPRAAAALRALAPAVTTGPRVRRLKDR